MGHFLLVGKIGSVQVLRGLRTNNQSLRRLLDRLFALRPSLPVSPTLHAIPDQRRLRRRGTRPLPARPALWFPLRSLRPPPDLSPLRPLFRQRVPPRRAHVPQRRTALGLPVRVHDRRVRRHRLGHDGHVPRSGEHVCQELWARRTQGLRGCGADRQLRPERHVAGAGRRTGPVRAQR